MSFNLQDKSKIINESIEYNYYNTLLGSQEKTLQNNGYLKYEFSNSVSSSFSNPNLSFKNNKYVSQSIYIFNHFYNIQNINYDGMLIIENKPITNTTSSNIFTVFLLKSNSMLSNDIDGLFDKSISSLELNKYISSNQPAIVFDNVLLFTFPISIHSKFYNFITPQYVSVGLLNSFSNNYSIMSANQSNVNVENFDNVYNKIEDASFENDVTCHPSDNITGSDITKIAMVPVDSDFLNGVYQISMMRTLFDIFIFIIILIVCIFVSPLFYKYIIVDFAKKYNANPEMVISFLDSFFSIILITIGLTLSIDGLNTKNGTEMIIGIYFTIIVFFSICAIRYNKITNTAWGLVNNQSFIQFSFTKILEFLRYLFFDLKFGKYLVIVYLLCLFLLFTAWLVSASIMKTNQIFSWGIFIGLVSPLAAFFLSYIALVIYNRFR